jgi:hypothetical protein
MDVFLISHLETAFFSFIKMVQFDIYLGLNIECVQVKLQKQRGVQLSHPLSVIKQTM